MVCDEVKRVAYFFLDGTLAETRRSAISSHLDLCPECKARTTFHLLVRIFVQKRLSHVAAPPRLKQRLTRSLRAFAE